MNIKTSLSTCMLIIVILLSIGIYSFCLFCLITSVLHSPKEIYRGGF